MPFVPGLHHESRDDLLLLIKRNKIYLEKETFLYSNFELREIIKNHFNKQFQNSLKTKKKLTNKK